MALTELPVPVRRGDTLTLPKGTIVHTTAPSRSRYALTRRQAVRVHAVVSGYVSEPSDDDGEFARRPFITWIGSGGYWHDAQVTREMLTDNGLDASMLDALPNSAPTWSLTGPR